MTFKEAFAKARKEKGPGKTFTWNGKKYTTNYASEEKVSTSPRPKAKPRTNLRASVKTRESPRPKARPKKETTTSRAPKTSPRPKSSTYPRVRNSVKKEQAKIPSRQTLGENLRSAPNTLRKAINNVFRPNPEREKRMKDAWDKNISP